jgi:hypothetical protein
MRYFLSLPPGYQRRQGRRWPVLVCVDCAGSNFRQTAEAFRKARGELPLLVVAPCTFSNTNAITGYMLEKYRRLYPDELIRKFGRLEWDLEWDEAGLLGVLDDLWTDFDAEGRVYLTGFSGGGLIAYRMIFKHPDLLAGAAPECANFFGPDYRALKGRFSADDLGLPVHLILGEQDHNRASTKASQFFSTPLKEFAQVTAAGLALGLLVWRATKKVRWVVAVGLGTAAVLGLFGAGRTTGLDAQTDAAAGVLADLGYRNVKRTLIPGMGHEGRPGPVLDAFRPYVLNQKKRTDPVDFRPQGE